MKTRNLTLKTGGLMAVLLLVAAPFGAMAATDAGTDVVNSVTSSYEVNSTPITGPTDTVTFKVDKLVGVAVANQDGGYASTGAQPGSTNAQSVYLITNASNVSATGNTFVELSAYLPTAPADDPNGPNPTTQTITTVTYSSTVCSASTAIANDVVTLTGQADTATVYVCATIPTAAVDGDTATIGLVTTAVTDATGNTNVADQSGTDKNANLTTEYTILVDAANAAVTGDAANDGSSSAVGSYLVVSADLTVAKTVQVISDLTGSVTPHAIPGAVVEYTVAAANDAAASQTADNVSIQDTLDANTTYVAGSITVNGNACADGGTVAVVGDVSGNPAGTATCAVAGQVLTISGYQIEAGDTVTITYQSTVN